MTNHEPKHPPADMAGLDGLIEVTQADRDAAKSLLGREDAGPSWWSIDSGNADNDRMVQAFARHRATQLQALAARVKVLEAENERLREALSWAEDADPVLVDAIRNRAGLGKKRDLPKCFGSIEVTRPQSRAENCCDDCPVEGLCRAALGEKQ